jgi:hypothetical protein
MAGLTAESWTCCGLTLSGVDVAAPSRGGWGV